LAQVKIIDAIFGDIKDVNKIASKIYDISILQMLKKYKKNQNNGDK
jgi:hypothetical protein